LSGREAAGLPEGVGAVHPATKVILRATRRVACALFVALLTALGLTQEADAAPSLRVACDVYATNTVDPITFGDHLHRQFGNTSTSNSSSFQSLHANTTTSCDGKWWTNAGWFPVERDEPVRKVLVYYRGPGDQTRIHDIPNGLQIIAKKVKYNCDASPGKPAPMQDTPPYGCAENWGTHVTFPSCWNGWGLGEDATVYGPTRSVCPASNPIRLPEIAYLITHPNTDGRVPKPLRVSSGTNEWGNHAVMHADYLFAAQDQFQQDVDLNGDGTVQREDGGYNEEALLDLCIRDAPDALEYNNARCRAGGLLPWHTRALNNYYN
jgi:hypothetical protein